MRERIVSGERGQALVLGVLMLVVLIGITSLVIDLGFVWNEKADLQKSADAAALAGIYYLPGDPDTAYAKAAEWAERNGVEEGDYDIAVKSVLTSDGNLDTVEVVVSGSTKAFFARVFGFTVFDVKARAVARVGSPTGVKNFIPFAVLEDHLGPAQTGDLIVMKMDTQDFSKGNALLLDLPVDECPEAKSNSALRKAIICGSSQEYCAVGQEYEGCPSTVPTKTGQNVGPVQTALDDRINKLTSPECYEFDQVFLDSPDGQSDYVLSDRCNPWAPYSVPDSKRITILPVIENIPTGTSSEVTITRFALFFITELTCGSGNQCELKGIYVQNIGNFGGYEKVGAYTEVSPFIIRQLVE